MQDMQATASMVLTSIAGGGRREGWGALEPALSPRRKDGGQVPVKRPPLPAPPRGATSALLVLLVLLGVAGEDKVVVVELGQLAVQTLVALELLGRRKDTATFGALERKRSPSPRARGQTDGHTQGRPSPVTHLIDKKRGDELPGLEDVHHPSDQIVVGGLGEVGFKADVGELWLRGDVNSPVGSLEVGGGGGGGEEKKQVPSHRRPTPTESC